LSKISTDKFDTEILIETTPPAQSDNLFYI